MTTPKMVFNRRGKTHHQYDYPASSAGPASQHVTVLVADALGDAGKELAAGFLARCEEAFDALQKLFGSTTLPSVTCILAPLSGSHDGTGGAYHYGCNGTDIYVDADLSGGNGATRTLASFIAELSEAGQAVQGKGFDCGASNGEGLSRFHAELLFPGALDDFTTFGAWLDSDREDWVSKKQATDLDEFSTGCSVGFLWWLVMRGHTAAAITAAGGATLASTFSALGEHGSAWSLFDAACAAKWPKGKPSKVATDNPWTGSPPPAPSPSPTMQVGTLVLNQTLTAGTWFIVPPTMLQLAKRLGIGVPDLLQLLTLVLNSYVSGPVTLPQLIALLQALESVLAPPPPSPPPPPPPPSTDSVIPRPKVTTTAARR